MELDFYLSREDMILIADALDIVDPDEGKTADRADELADLFRREAQSAA